MAERKINTESSWNGWQNKRKIGRRKISRSIPARTVLQMIDGWHFARDLKLPFNRFVTIRPALINDLTPDERVAYWETARNKIAQFARDNDFEHVSLWSRESTRDTGQDEHLHLLTHVPLSIADRFDGTANRWYGDSDEIKIKPADYRLRRQRSGNIHTAVTYLAKNSPQAARVEKLRLTYRLGGPILGKRVGWSRNISPAAQARHEARFRIQGEFGYDRAVRADLR